MKKLLLLLPFVTFCFQVSATQFYWVGASGANWSVATNWKMGGFTGSVATTHPRTSSDSAYMGNGSTNATITLDSSFSIRALFFLGSGQIFVNGAGKRLTISGDFNTSANIGTTGGGSSTIRMAGGAITGNATTEDVGKIPNLVLTGSCSLNGLITMGGSTTLFDSSATISAGTSTVVFYYNDSIKGNPNFNNAEFQGSAGTHTVKDSMTVADSLKISGSGACTINTGTVKVQGDINISNTSNGGAGGAGTATIKLNGSGSQTITSTNGTTGLGLLPIVNIAKTGGTLNLSGVISVAGSWLNNYNGTVNAGTSEVYLKANSGNTLNIGGTYPTAFYQLMLDSHGGTYNFAIDSAAIITNELLMVGSGNIVCNNHSLVIKGDVSITNTGGGIGNSAFIFNGNNSQTITSTGSGDNGFLTNVIINKDGGTLSLSGIISIDGGFTNNYGGTINAGTSTVLFRAGSGITFGIAGSYSTTFYNLDLESEGGVFSFDRDSAAIVTGKLLLIGGSQLTCNNHSLFIKGNMQMTNSNAAVNGNTVFTVCGTGAQGFSGSVVVLNNVVINKPAGAFTLSQYLDVNTNLTLTKGNMVSSLASLLYFKNGATVTGASDSSFVSGPVAKAGNQAFKFPLGDTTAHQYKPISISAPGTTTDVFTAQYYNSGIADGHDGVLTYVDPCEHWNIVHTTGSSAVHDTLFWNNPCFHIASLSYFKIGYVSGSTWTSVGTCTTSGNTTTGAIAASFVAGNVTLAKTNPLVVAYAGNDTAICSGLSATLNGTVTGGTSPFTYSWSPAMGLSSSTAANPTATPTVTTTYILTVTDNLTEFGMDTMVLTINPNPTMSTETNKGVCPGSSVVIGAYPEATGGTSPYLYSWSPATGLNSSTIANPAANPTVTTTYTLTLTDNNGCTSSASVSVTANTNPTAYAGRDTTIAYGSPTIIGASPAATGGASPYNYRWYPATGLSSPMVSQPTAYPQGNTSYALVVTDANGCTASDTMVTTMTYTMGTYVIPDTESTPVSFAFYYNYGQIIDTQDSLRPDITLYTTAQYPAMYIRKDTMSFVFSKINTDTSSSAPDSLARVDMFFAGYPGGPARQTFPYQPVPQYLNYFLPQCPKGIVNVSGYQKVAVKNIYTGIDLLYTGNNTGGLKYQIVCTPGGDPPGHITMRFNGAQSVTVDDSGTLHITTQLGEIDFKQPVAYEEEADGSLVPEAWAPAYAMDEGDIQFTTGTYDESKNLVFKMEEDHPATRGVTGPDWCTFIQANGNNGFNDVQTMQPETANSSYATGRYVVGYSESIDYPKLSGYQTTLSGAKDAVVATFLADDELRWATYFGGNTNDAGKNGTTVGTSICALNNGPDNLRTIYFTGYTDCNDIVTAAGSEVYGQDKNNNKTTNALMDAFIVELDPTGTIAPWVTYFGDAATGNQGNGIVINYSPPEPTLNVVGSCYSPFETNQQYGPTTAYCHYGPNDYGFLAQFSLNGRPVWTTKIPSTDDLQIMGVNCDANDNIYICGSTDDINNNLPVSNGTTFSGVAGTTDGFIISFNYFDEINWGTYWGGTGNEACNSIVCLNNQYVFDLVDNQTSIWVTGETNTNDGSLSLPAPTGITNTTTYAGGSSDIFVLEYVVDPSTPSSTTLQYGTLLGGSGQDQGNKICGDDNSGFGNIYVAGTTNSTDLTLPSPNPTGFYDQRANGGSNDGVIIGIQAYAPTINWTTYFGGANDDFGNGIADNSESEKVYVVGSTGSTGSTFPLQTNSPSYYYGTNQGTTGYIARFPVGTVVTGVKEISNNSSKSLEVYPDPSSGNVYLDIPNLNPSDLTIKIYNVLGEIVNGNIKKSVNFPLQMDLSNLADGIYIIKLIDGKTIYTGKLIIQR